MEEKVLNTICKYNMIDKGDNIVLGLSGGHDSIVLLHMLLYAQKKLSFNLILAHVNHGVRGEDALRDEMFVRNLSKRLDLQYFSTKVDMIGVAKEKNISEEEAGRELRYDFFRSIIKKLGKGKIAVAHNRKDQAETLIMRIMRGTGIDGLKGMDFKIGDIIRPILDIDRWEIEKYIEDNNIETVLDRTNLETIYTRNKVRLELIPYIEKNFNPNIIDTLFRLSENAKLDSEFLEKYTNDRYESSLKRRTDKSKVFDYNIFKDEELSIKKRIIRKSIENLNNSLQGIEHIHISSVIELFSRKETGKMINLPNDIVARISYDDLIIEKNKENEFNSFNSLEKNLIIGENILKEHNVELTLEVFNKKDIVLERQSKNVKYFDYDKIIDGIFIRKRKPGDRFVPFGMKGSKKLKDYFIDEKVPRQLREKIPLLVDGKNIIWVIGYRTNEIYKVDENTKTILKIKYKNKETWED
ncbi:MAG: tRNA lysidine(34) synthetase TilS [Tissierella sp.]|uniref:tRNA lysidine(34) synthetase TilS n=1 Tax=Tissierella sp. TaxID=41274 RepID=UPI003F9B9527